MNRSIKLIICLVLLFTACQKDSPVWVAGWQKTTPLTTQRAGAAVLEAGGFIYAIGGVDGKNFLRSTEYAKIMEDGSLGPWQSGPLMDEARGFTDAAVHNGYIYVVGGGNGPNGKILLRTVERARIQPGGGLTPWVKGKYGLNMPRRCTKVTVLGDHLYAFGGFGGDLLKTVEHAKIMDDGSLGEWFEEENNMTFVRYISAVKSDGDIAYVIGGHHPMEGVGIADTEWAKVYSDSGFQKWNKTSQMQVERYGLSTALHGGNLYAIGGVTGVEYLDSIEKSAIEPDRGLSKWSLSTPLSSPRSLHSSIVYKDWIYVLGGTGGNGYHKSVEYATFNGTGDIGFWSDRKKATEKVNENKDELSEKKSSLPNRGIVVDTIEAKRYLYIKVTKKGGFEWLAGPKMSIALGSRIRYSKGVFMSDFYSKELKRTFPSVLFVGKVETEHW